MSTVVTSTPSAPAFTPRSTPGCTTYLELPGVVFRRCRPADKQAVIDITSGLYGGTDYLALNYDIMMQDPRCVCGLAERDDDVIGFYLLRLDRNGKMVTGEAARTKESERGVGLLGLMAFFVVAEARAMYPDVCYLAGLIGSSTRTDGIPFYQLATLVSQLYLGIFTTTAQDLSRSMSTLRENVNDDIQVKSLVGKEDLVQDSVLKRVIHGELFSALTNCQVFNKSTANIRYLSRTASVMYSTDEQMHSTASSSKNTNSAASTSSFTGLSFGDVSFNGHEVLVTCHLYCSSSDVTSAHLRHHLRHAARVCPPEMKMRLLVVSQCPEDTPVLHGLMCEEAGCVWVPCPYPRETMQIYRFHMKDYDAMCDLWNIKASS